MKVGGSAAEATGAAASLIIAGETGPVTAERRQVAARAIAGRVVPRPARLPLACARKSGESLTNGPETTPEGGHEAVLTACHATWYWCPTSGDICSAKGDKQDNGIARNCLTDRATAGSGVCSGPMR